MSPDFFGLWLDSAGNERANKDTFLLDLCDFLDVPRPGAKDKSPDYCFEKDIQRFHAEGKISTVSIDFFRAGSFAWEAKQGSTKESPGSSPARGTRAYQVYMEKAFRQAMGYNRDLNKSVPFVITCDIGHSIQVWECFDGVTPGYGARKDYRLKDLKDPEVREFFRTIFLNPESLSPTKRRAKVTREVAERLGHLASALETQHPPEVIARFLMRCVFTFFAEDIGLLPDKLFERALKNTWEPHPEKFVSGLQRLWDLMNTGGDWAEDRIARFNGGLFAETTVLPLTKLQIGILRDAAISNWALVDPSIFGTLLESALNPEERHRLGAHYTPRIFIERLLRPALEEPIRQEWDLVQAEALTVLGANPTDAERAKGRAILHAYHSKLARTTVLDPACGSGNFLYVAYDILKGIEQELLSRLVDLGETMKALALDSVMVTPAQFHGIELKPWAASIAELVLWIGHLQWYQRLFPGQVPPEPILQRYETIENRDAVLTCSSKKKTDRSRWDGKTFRKHPVTGKDVPDETAQVPIERLVNPKPAKWPVADFIVGNPPFLGKSKMRDELGDGYVEALRAVYPDVPDSVDFVLYWWHKAACAVQSGRTRRFGLITTNSLTQTFNRRVIAHHTKGSTPIKLLWAIGDHPWTDEGAAVRIAMSVGGLEGKAWLGSVKGDAIGETPEVEAEAIQIVGQCVDLIHEDLRAGANVAGVKPLRANRGVACVGVQLSGAGFLVSNEQWVKWGCPPVVRPYRNGRDLTDHPRNAMAIDLFGLTEAQVREQYPGLYQYVLENVKPEREQNNRESYRNNWWIFAEPRASFRPALTGLKQYCATVRVAKHRVFSFVDGETIPDTALVAIATDDPFILGVLSSKVHEVWSKAAGSLLEDRPRYDPTKCFDPFPFPAANDAQRETIRSIAIRLDKHRKAAQERGVTITGMYNLLLKLRSGEEFNQKEREQHSEAQTEILRQIHDELDQAVVDSYGWTVGDDESAILDQVVALNRERAEEEWSGRVRWIRPDYQTPRRALELVAVPVLDVAEGLPGSGGVVGIEPRGWPKEIKDQLSGLREVILATNQSWTVEDLTKVFKSRGRYRESIEAHLELLADLGVIVRVEGASCPAYHRPVDVAKAS